jgi:glycosyltransferase involved in cell wall biosynthesis
MGVPQVMNGKRIVVVMPAFRAEHTLRATYEAIPHEVVDDVLLTDDASDDGTVELARSLSIRTFVHKRNLGYGGNQKTCYTEALRLGADVIVMLHPDYQYDPRLITPLASMITSGVYDLVLASRILGGTARAGGMPLWKYMANRALTLGQNIALASKLSEFHTGYRAYSRAVLESLPLLANSNDFVFDNQILVQAIAADFRIGEISCPTSYHAEASSINFLRSVKYGVGVLFCSLQYIGWRAGVLHPRILQGRPEDRLSAFRLATQTADVA